MTKTVDCPYCGEQANNIPEKGNTLTVYECWNGHGFNENEL